MLLHCANWPQSLKKIKNNKSIDKWHLAYYLDKVPRAFIALWKLWAASISQKTTSYSSASPRTNPPSATTCPSLPLAPSVEVLTFINKYKQESYLQHLRKGMTKYRAKNKLFEREDWQLNYPTEEGGYRLPVLSLRHQRKLMMYLIENPNSRNIGILLALCTGMRIGEVCTLQ